MSRILIQGVQSRHRVENLGEACSRIALISDEEQACVIEHALMPGRLTLGREPQLIVIGVAAPQDLGSARACGGAETHMRIVRKDEISVVPQVEIC